MQAFLVSMLIKVLSDPKVQNIIKDLLGSLITERIVPLIPVAAASAAKAVIDMIPGVDAVVDAVKVADNVRNDLNKVIPDIDIGVPAIDNLLDFWRPKG